MDTKKFKLLSFSLITSLSLNIGLIAALIYCFAEKEMPLSPKKERKEVVKANTAVFKSMTKLSFRELVSFLTNKEPLEEGYTKRDLSVAALVAYHDFNLEKALGARPSQVRTLVLSKDHSIDLFAGLSEEQFEAIIRFAYQEKWPLTAKGLFTYLKNQKIPRDESLEQAFCLSAEFQAVQLLFQKTKAPQDSKTLLNFIASGNWEILTKFFQEPPEFSEEKRRELLLSYKSPEASYLLITTDFQFALKTLDDKQILDLLAHLKTDTDISRKFCIELLQSPRTDQVHQEASLTLYAYAEEMPPLPIDPQTTLVRFSSPASKPEAPPPVPLPSRFHVVKEGESLWKISRQYKVTVDEIVQMNSLEGNSLFPGMTLKLPQGTGSEPPR